MKNIIDVTGGKGGNVFLVIGDQKTALLDSGMAYCAADLIGNIKKILGNRDLDYILIGHSHYDHVAGIPYLREIWPAVEVLGAQHAQVILQKESALRSIRTLSVEAVDIYQGNPIKEYDDTLMKIDKVVADGDQIDLGNTIIQVLETIGHTRCSLSFFIDKETFFASESTGYMSRAGSLYPGFLTSLSDAMESIRISEACQPQIIISPHFGFLDQQYVASYWDRCRAVIEETKNFILKLAAAGCSEEEILDQYEQEFRDEEIKIEQPAKAFRINSKNMIKAVLRLR